MQGSDKVSFLIIGGGIGGLSAALGIAQAGRNVHVLEREPEFTELGAGLELAPNATRVLNKLGVLNRILENFAVFPKRLVIKDAMSGKELTALDLGESFRQRYNSPYIVMHRSDLLNVLLEACIANENITLSTSKKVESVIERGKQYQVGCEDGTTYLAESVIGADGIRSTTRRFISKDELIPYPYATYRGTVPFSEVKTFANPEDVTLWTGPGIHFVGYALRQGGIFNLAAIFKSSRYKTGSEQWGTPDELEEHFKNSCSDVQNGLKYILRDRKWMLFDRDPITNWTKGRMTLLGDAAHPMLQYLAQGACQALEDASCLADQINYHGSDIEKALYEYQQERMVRTAKVQGNARIFGEVLHFEDPISIMTRNNLFTRRKADDYSDVDWLYAYEAVRKNSIDSKIQ